jgi:hypothetical protein
MRSVVALVVLSLCLAGVGCGPGGRAKECTGEACASGACEPGQVRDCYTGREDTLGVGPCIGGEQKCSGAGQWGSCFGQVVPVGEICGDGIDQNCNGAIDENEDRDNDGFTTCDGDCCDSTECSRPELANPNAFDAPDNNVDDDCDSAVDNSVGVCDQGIASNTMNAMDFAKAIDLCQVTTVDSKKWGVISAKLTLPDGMGVPDAVSHAVRARFGANNLPRVGGSLAVFSTGHAASKGDVNPAYHDFDSAYAGMKTSGYPTDFIMANNGNLPNAPGCPDPMEPGANDPVMLTLEIRVPSNAKSFSLKTDFYSSEFPEFTCTEYNDFFVVLLDSMYLDEPKNPKDKNLAFYTPMGGSMNYPVGVNLAHGNTGLFTQCQNGETGCSGDFTGMITTCTGQDELANTGFDDPSPARCEIGSKVGGATGWLTTRGNVVPGEIIKLRVAIWDTNDNLYDSLALVDAFQWSIESTQPGTVILREDQPGSPLATEAVPMSGLK